MTTSRRGLWIGCVIGAPFLVVGVRGVLTAGNDVLPADLGPWLLGAALVHDGLVLPIVCAVAVVAHRLTPGWAWPAARWCLMTTAVLALVSRPFVAGWGYNKRNPTALVRPYGSGTLIAVGVVWCIGLAWAAWDFRQRPARVVRASDGR